MVRTVTPKLESVDWKTEIIIKIVKYSIPVPLCIQEVFSTYQSFLGLSKNQFILLYVKIVK
jgi:hypothetical protein